MSTSYLDKSGMSAWESADVLDERSHAATVSAAQAATMVSDQDVTWQKLGAQYEGDHESELVNGFFVPVENAARIVLAIDALDAAIVEFADELRTLQSSRTRFEQSVDEYNAVYGALGVEELPPNVLAWRTSLTEIPADLEAKYQDAARNCASAIRGVELDDLDMEKVEAGRPGTLPREVLQEAMKNALPIDPENPSTAALGLLDVSRVREPWLRANGVIPETWQARFLGMNVGPLGASVFAAGSAMLRAAQTRSWAPVRNIPLAMAMTMRHQSNPRTRAAMAFEDPRGLRKPTWSALGKQFLDGLPVTGFVRSTMPLWGNRTLANAGDPAPAMDTAFRVESKGAFRLNAAVKGLGAAGTVVGAGLTYEDEYEQQLQENRTENPNASRAEIEDEAAQDAGAQTAGNVLSTVAVSAATGAVAGSVLPGPGNVVGFAAGVVSGVAMAVPIADTDRDGQKDSAAEMAGDLAEGAWNWIRGK